ncbi:MAG: baeRF7 domain-containing protein [Planctomycetota bacterium]|jgi:hypothetical protein
MRLLQKAELEDLITRRDGPCVSIYMPTHRAGREVQQNPIRLKNLLREAEDGLEAMGMPQTDARTLLAPAHKLLTDKQFWEHQNDGLALFMAEDWRRGYRLPVAFEEKAIVGRRFHVKPLLPLLCCDGRFFILALSQNEVRLLEGSRFTVGSVDLEGVPADLAEALRFDDPEKSVQYHSGTTQGGRRAAGYHGHGTVESTEKDNLLRYFRRIDKGLVKMLEGERAPLVLAGVEHYFPIYREANNYAQLMERGVPGSPDVLTAEALHARAWEVVAPIFHAAQETAVARYERAAGTGKTSRQVEEIALAAHHGKVDVLFVALGKQCWGRFEDDNGGLAVVHREAEPGDLDLLDFAAARTFRSGGTVFALPPEKIPARSPAAAIFRY